MSQNLKEIKAEAISRLISEKVREDKDIFTYLTIQEQLDRKFKIEKEITKRVEYTCKNSCVNLETEEDLLESYQMFFYPEPEIKEKLAILELDMAVAL